MLNAMLKVGAGVSGFRVANVDRLVSLRGVKQAAEVIQSLICQPVCTRRRPNSQSGSI